mmetsp:Transcript_16797/g.58608  ORF Transcript_16797/g.58608 Transcript_16797/m.58608 type:complete len:293 (+) Transcript_16797:357-1235(+)
MISEYRAPRASAETPCSSVDECTVASPSERSRARTEPPQQTSKRPPSNEQSSPRATLTVTAAESVWNGFQGLVPGVYRLMNISASGAAAASAALLCRPGPANNSAGRAKSASTASLPINPSSCARSTFSWWSGSPSTVSGNRLREASTAARRLAQAAASRARGRLSRASSTELWRPTKAASCASSGSRRASSSAAALTSQGAAPSRSKRRTSGGIRAACARKPAGVASDSSSSEGGCSDSGNGPTIDIDSNGGGSDASGSLPPATACAQAGPSAVASPMASRVKVLRTRGWI